MDHVTIYIILAGALGLFMAWGIGANDVANAMGTAIGSKVLTIKQAVIIAGIFEFAGAFLAGGQVTSTIRKGIIDSGAVAQSPDLASVFNRVFAMGKSAADAIVVGLETPLPV